MSEEAETIKIEEDEEFDELDGFQLKKRRKMLLLEGEITLELLGGDESKKEGCILQERKQDDLLFHIAQLEQELAASANLAAERLGKIVQLQSSLDSVTHERDGYMVECQKAKEEIFSLKSYIKNLKKRARARDGSRAKAEVEVLRTQIAAWSHFVGSQAMRIRLLEEELAAFCHADPEKECSHILDWHPCRKANKLNIFPCSKSESVLLPSLPAVNALALTMQPIDQSQMSQSYGALASRDSGSASDLGMQHRIDNISAEKDDYSSSQDFSQGDLLRNINCVVEPTCIWNDAKVKKDGNAVCGRLLVGESADDTMKETCTANSDAGVAVEGFNTFYRVASCKAVNNVVNLDKVGHSFHESASVVEGNTKNKIICPKLENLEDLVAYPQQIIANTDAFPVKVKEEIPNENCVDGLDDVPLKERMKRLVSSRVSYLNYVRYLNCLQQSVNCTPQNSSDLRQEVEKTVMRSRVPPEIDWVFGSNGSTVVKASAVLPVKQEVISMEESTQDSSAAMCGPSSAAATGSCLPIPQKMKNKKRRSLSSVGGELEICNSRTDPVDSSKIIPKGLSHRRKRKKTLTDSVEQALEEDAPGILQVLLDKGIKVNEIKLYGEKEDEELIDIPSETSFEDLEAVVSKLFCSSTTLLKFPPLRQAKGSKASYCLSCLVSLVEQTQYLRLRKWPVEWGWCRELQSFIFVFERHNRIVLERPEYGYATYFFELEDSVPIEWQIKRLVTIMKLSNCSRVTIIENKPLQVGEDLTEAEARILEEYGWRPNSGLATMLHYCDRVVHDRKSEGDSSEWRTRIGKLLMEGYDGGTIVMAKLPKGVIDCESIPEAQLKVEV